MNKDITFLVNSCDKYEDAWHPFFECLRIFGVPTEYEMVLNTETKQYSSDYFNVRVVNTPEKCTWSERLMNVVSQIDTEYIFFTLEDYFLKAPFDNERLQKVIEFMNKKPDVGFADISPRYAGSTEEAESNKVEFRDVEDEFVIRNNEKYNINTAVSVWRTSALKKLIRPHEDVWQFEYYSGYRARNEGIKVLRYRTSTPTIFEYDFQVWSGMGITRGQWLPKNPEFFEQLGIDVNFDRLGILNVSSVAEIRELNRSSLKTMIKKIPRKIRWYLDKPKSLK